MNVLPDKRINFMSCGSSVNAVLHGDPPLGIRGRLRTIRGWLRNQSKQRDSNMSLVKRVTSASAQLTLSNALVRLLSLVTMPILTQLLSPAAYGTAAMAGTIISLISVIGLAGMDMSYVRAYSLYPSQSVEVFAWRYAWGAGILSCLGVVVVWPFIADMFALPGYLGVLLGMAIVLSLTATMAQARARLDSRYAAMSLSIIISGLGLTAVSLSVAQWWRQDEIPLILAMMAGYLFPLLVLGLPSVRQLWHGSTLSLEHRRYIFRIGMAGTITAPAYWIISSSDRWFLGYFQDAAAAGIYSMGYSVAIFGMMANSAVLSVWTPETVREYETNSEHAPAVLGMTAERLITGFACIWLAITASGGDIIRLLAAPSFHQAVVVIPAIAAAVMCHGVIHIANAIYLLHKRLERTLWMWITGAIISLILNAVLIPRLGLLGAAVSQTISFFLIALGMVVGAQRIYPLKVNWFKLGCIVSGLTLSALFMFPAWAANPGVSILMKLPIGILIVLIVTRFIAPEVWQSTVKKIRSQYTKANPTL